MGFTYLSSEEVGYLQFFLDVYLLFLLDQMFLDLVHSFLLLLLLSFLHHGLEFLGQIFRSSQFGSKVDVGDLAFPDG